MKRKLGALLLVVVGAPLMALLSCGDGTGDDGCETDNDCGGGRICDDGKCTEPQTGACVEPGNICVGPECCEGSICVSDGSSSVCAAECTSNSQCNSGCCAPVSGTDKSVCSPAEYCMGTGGAPGGSGG
jgi:hypothetical protein